MAVEGKSIFSFYEWLCYRCVSKTPNSVSNLYSCQTVMGPVFSARFYELYRTLFSYISRNMTRSLSGCVLDGWSHFCVVVTELTVN